ncbi:unnamed protein product, partial [Symbiodinium sp. CCMP2592]
MAERTAGDEQRQGVTLLRGRWVLCFVPEVEMMNVRGYNHVGVDRYPGLPFMPWPPEFPPFLEPPGSVVRPGDLL